LSDELPRLAKLHAGSREIVDIDHRAFSKLISDLVEQNTVVAIDQVTPAPLQSSSIAKQI
jgi:hypothetical protein